MRVFLPPILTGHLAPARACRITYLVSDLTAVCHILSNNIISILYDDDENISRSGFQLESDDPEYIATVKKNVDTARAHGIEVGAYDLIGWTRNSNGAVPGSMALAPDGHSTGSGACTFPSPYWGHIGVFWI